MNCAKISERTTPEANDIQHTLKEMLDAGVSHVSMEISSHALALFRTHGTKLRGAILTNLTQDHLDFHTDMQDYAEAKFKIFELVVQGGFGLIYGDDDQLLKYKDQYQSKYKLKLQTFGFNERCDFRACNLHFSSAGLKFDLVYGDTTLAIQSPLSGEYNALNCLAAGAAAILYGIDAQIVAQGIGALHNVPGRLERISSTNGVHVFVDYAHTSDALENVIKALRSLAEDDGGRLITVFGCGGDRDRSKRPLMGLAAVRGSDITVITSDNPRTEDPQRIIGDIVAPPEIEAQLTTANEIASKGRGAFVQVDRTLAIRQALEFAQPKDIVLIAGKGHEDYQEIHGVKHPFLDSDVVKTAMKELGWTIDFA